MKYKKSFDRYKKKYPAFNPNLTLWFNPMGNSSRWGRYISEYDVNFCKIEKTPKDCDYILYQFRFNHRLDYNAGRQVKLVTTTSYSTNNRIILSLVVFLICFKTKL